VKEIDHRIEVIELRPGDVLFVKTDRKITREEAEALRAQIMGQLPGFKVVVLSPELTLGAIREVRDE
jgi:hypothetical protein